VYVSATSETIRSRAKLRAEKTGQAVPEDLLQESIDQVPKSVAALAPLTDVTFKISNDDNHPMVLKKWEGEHGASTNLGWDDFKAVWVQNDNPDEKSAQTDHKDLVCKMMSTYDDPKEHQAAQLIWGKAYPTFCARCTLACDGQCGICVHEWHICACDICNQSATECPR
jgi:hypothetical protein